MAWQLHAVDEVAEDPALEGRHLARASSWAFALIASRKVEDEDEEDEEEEDAGLHG